MVNSINGLAKNSIPHNGRKVATKGSAAQCIAHANEVVIPVWSNAIDFIRNFMHKYK